MCERIGEDEERMLIWPDIGIYVIGTQVQVGTGTTSAMKRCTYSVGL